MHTHNTYSINFSDTKNGLQYSFPSLLLAVAFSNVYQSIREWHEKGFTIWTACVLRHFYA